MVLVYKDGSKQKRKLVRDACSPAAVGFSPQEGFCPSPGGSLLGLAAFPSFFLFNVAKDSGQCPPAVVRVSHTAPSLSPVPLFLLGLVLLCAGSPVPGLCWQSCLCPSLSAVGPRGSGSGEGGPVQAGEPVLTHCPSLLQVGSHRLSIYEEWDPFRFRHMIPTEALQVRALASAGRYRGRAGSHVLHPRPPSLHSLRFPAVYSPRVSEGPQ